MVIPFFITTRVDTDKGQGAETVVHDFERQRFERLFGRNIGVFASFVTVFVSQWLRLDFSRVRQEVDNGVQNQLYTFVLERRNHSKLGRSPG